MKPHELSLTRTFDAPYELVYRTWTEPGLLAQWWGPAGFKNTVHALDLQPGGSISIDMQAPDGAVYPMKGTFRETIAPERLVFVTTAFEDAAGIPGMADLTTVRFADNNGKTKFYLHSVITHVTSELEKSLDTWESSWNQSLDRLASLLRVLKGEIPAPFMKLVAEPGSLSVIITNTYRAPRELVFKASLDPQLIPQWWGPGYLTTTIDKLEAKPGGIWRFIQRDSEGNEFAFHGVFHDIVPPERIVQTFEWEGMPGHVLLATMVFEEHNGMTTTTETSIYQTVADRDGMLATGMEGGENESFTRLSSLLERLQSKR